MTLSYAVIGAGAVGGYYGGRLAHYGRDVHFLLHSDYGHVRTHGLRVDSAAGDFHLDNPLVHETTKSIPDVDVVLVALKTTDSHLVVDLVPPLARRARAVVLMQNGFANEEDLAPLLPDTMLIAGLCFVCSHKSGPGHITHLDYGAVTLAARGGSDEVPELVNQIAADFKAAGVPASVEVDIERARWQKLCWNMPFNGLSVVKNADTGGLVSDPASVATAQSIMSEVAAAAEARGHAVPHGFTDVMMSNTIAMTPYEPSMKLDYDQGRPMEIEFIYERAIAAGTAAGVPMPESIALAAQLRKLEASK